LEAACKSSQSTRTGVRVATKESPSAFVAGGLLRQTSFLFAAPSLDLFWPQVGGIKNGKGGVHCLPLRYCKGTIQYTNRLGRHDHSDALTAPLTADLPALELTAPTTASFCALSKLCCQRATDIKNERVSFFACVSASCRARSSTTGLPDTRRRSLTTGLHTARCRTPQINSTKREPLACPVDRYSCRTR